MDTVLHHKTFFVVVNSIPLSDNTAQGRVDVMSADVEGRLCSIIRNTEFSLQLDESAFPVNESLLLEYVCFVYDGVLYKELAMVLLLDTDVWQYFRKSKHISKKNHIPLTNVIARATDGDTSMIGRYLGFVAFLKIVNLHVSRFTA